MWAESSFDGGGVDDLVVLSLEIEVACLWVACFRGRCSPVTMVRAGDAVLIVKAAAPSRWAGTRRTTQQLPYRLLEKPAEEFASYVLAEVVKFVANVAKNILAYLAPVPAIDTKRVITFAALELPHGAKVPAHIVKNVLRNTMVGGYRALSLWR